MNENTSIIYQHTNSYLETIDKENYVDNINTDGKKKKRKNKIGYNNFKISLLFYYK